VASPGSRSKRQAVAARQHAHVQHREQLHRRETAETRCYEAENAAGDKPVGGEVKVAPDRSEARKPPSPPSDAAATTEGATAQGAAGGRLLMAGGAL
jgi:hypothetical protein